jgi:dipeptidase D
MIRSSVNSRRDRLRRKVETVAELCGGHCEFSGEYGAWEFNKDSELLSLVEKVYEEQYGEKPAVGAVHAGVECGKWAEKLGNIDAVSFGPDMLEVHSVNERLSISSTQRTWELLKGILAAMK